MWPKHSFGRGQGISKLMKRDFAPSWLKLIIQVLNEMFLEFPYVC